MLNQFVGDMGELVDNFVDGLMSYGAWYEHVNTYTSLPGVHIIHYEDLVEVYFFLNVFVLFCFVY